MKLIQPEKNIRQNTSGNLIIEIMSSEEIRVNKSPLWYPQFKNEKKKMFNRIKPTIFPTTNRHRLIPKYQSIRRYSASVNILLKEKKVFEFYY